MLLALKVNCEALGKGDEKKIKMMKKQLLKAGSVLSWITYFQKIDPT